MHTCGPHTTCAMNCGEVPRYHVQDKPGGIIFAGCLDFRGQITRSTSACVIWNYSKNSVEKGELLRPVWPNPANYIIYY